MRGTGAPGARRDPGIPNGFRISSQGYNGTDIFSAERDDGDPAGELAHDVGRVNALLANKGPVRYRRLISAESDHLGELTGVGSTQDARERVHRVRTVGRDPEVGRGDPTRWPRRERPVRSRSALGSSRFCTRENRFDEVALGVGVVLHGGEHVELNGAARQPRGLRDRPDGVGGPWNIRWPPRYGSRIRSTYPARSSAGT